MKKIVILICTLLVGLFGGFIASYFIEGTGDYSNVISAIVGAAVALMIPIWQTYVIQQAKLTLEINGINRKISNRTRLSLDEYSELSYLKKRRQDDTPFITLSEGKPKRVHQDKTINLDELLHLLELAKQDLKEYPDKIADIKGDIDKLNGYKVTSFSKRECYKFNQPLNPEVTYLEGNHQETIDKLKESYRDRLVDFQDKYNNLQLSLPEIERKVSQLKSDLIENHSYFEMSVTLINSGRLNTSVKKPALFRVYIGKENYIDLKLTFNDFENKSQISSNSTIVGTFTSTDISHLPEEDRKLINTYWGQSVQCVLFVEDIHGKAASSNAIAFSEGLYQKIIFDRLATIATNKKI